MDPMFGGGYAGKSMMHSRAVLFGYSDDPEDECDTAMELAQKAADLDPDLPESHSALGFAYSALGQHEKAVSAARRAVELQPGDAEAHFSYSRCLRGAGDFDQACSEASNAIRLNPLYLEGPYLNNFARAAFLAGRYQDAMEAYERNSAQGGPSYVGQKILRAATCSLCGHIDKARELVGEILKERPDLCLNNIPSARGDIRQDELEKVREALRSAGLPE